MDGPLNQWSLGSWRCESKSGRYGKSWTLLKTRRSFEDGPLTQNGRLRVKSKRLKSVVVYGQSGRFRNWEVFVTLTDYLWIWGSSTIAGHGLTSTFTHDRLFWSMSVHFSYFAWDLSLFDIKTSRLSFQQKRNSTRPNLINENDQMTCWYIVQLNLRHFKTCELP